MDNDGKNQSGQSSSDKQTQSAVPYTPPPPPNDSSSRKLSRTPLMNGMLAAVAILLGGFMLYHYVGYQLTTLAGISQTKTVIPSPSPSSGVPSVFPSVSPSVSPSQEVSPSPTP
jgi:hypothetical protein